MAWDKYTVNAFNRLRQAKEKLELAKMRYERGLDPRTGVNPQEFIAGLEVRVDTLTRELERFKRGEHDHSE